MSEGEKQSNADVTLWFFFMLMCPDALSASPPDGDQKETGGVCKEGASAEDQGVPLTFKKLMSSVVLIDFDGLYKQKDKEAVSALQI